MRPDWIPFDPAQGWLERYVRSHGGVAGSIHSCDGIALHLMAALAIPDPVLESILVVPRGKGLAGVAFAERRSIVSLSLEAEHRRGRGDAPGASAAIPVLDDYGDVRAVVGIAFANPRSLAPGDLEALSRSASLLIEATT